LGGIGVGICYTLQEAFCFPFLVAVDFFLVFGNVVETWDMCF
jgi:hypothetical protein